jgi:hypothetical protein
MKDIEGLMCLSCILVFLLEDCKGGNFQQHQIIFLSKVSRWPPKKSLFEGVHFLPTCLSDNSTLKWKWVELLVEWCLQGKSQVHTWSKTYLQHCPKQILVWYTWIWVLDSAVRRRLIFPSMMFSFSGGGLKIGNLIYCIFTRYFYQYELQRSSSIEAGLLCDN